MTDTRIPEQWLYDPRWLRLTPAVRADALAWLVWSVARRADGVLEIADLGLCTWPTDLASVDVLLGVGILRQVDAERVQFVDFEDTQTSAAKLQEMEDRRRSEAERKRKSRARSRAESVRVTSGGRPADGHVTAQDRTGQDRKGLHDSFSAPVMTWPTVDVPTYDPEEVF